MKRRLRVLLVEDRAEDALLVVRALEKDGFDVEFTRVETERAMREQLQSVGWDVIIADFSLPHFSARHALDTMHSLEIDLPFVIVSGSIDEEAAVEAIRAGAHDFISKGRFARLAPAIEREMREATVRAERERMRRELLLADRMASLGTLAAGVAHEINNPLTAVVGGLELAVEELAQCSVVDEPERVERISELLRDAQEASERVRNIVRELKSFSRSDDAAIDAVDIHSAIDASIRIVRHELKHSALLTTIYATVPPVRGNEARLSQVFLNLLVNAAHSMPSSRSEGNQIVVATSLAKDGRVSVEVRDNGQGIRADLVKRIFDPFFTTKTVDRGMGLGLSICQRIVSELGGEISVESTEGEGTTFRTLLPVFHGANAEEGAALRPAWRLKSRSEPRTERRLGAKILIIDDDLAVAKVARRLLARDHDVTVVTDPRLALTLLAQESSFEIILCDLMMPEVTGMDVYREVARLDLNPPPRMAFMSGGAFTDDARTFLAQVRCPHIEKPFNRDALLHLIDELSGR